MCSVLFSLKQYAFYDHKLLKKIQNLDNTHEKNNNNTNHCLTSFKLTNQAYLLISKWAIHLVILRILVLDYVDRDYFLLKRLKDKIR